MIPYGRQSIDENDIQAVVEVLKSDWLTTGPKVQEFEQAIADYVGAKYAVAVSNGTAALHATMYALGIGAGDEVIVPPMTFAASANCVVYQGGTPIFVDVDLDTLLIDSNEVERKITPKTKAIIAVDYGGQPCEYDVLRDICARFNIALVADGCHALGAKYKNQFVGTLADATVFSFHPVKHITTGEGGMITTDNDELARRMRIFRNHGITTDHRQRDAQGSWFYEMVDLGYNYRITDFQCALGISQLKKLPEWIDRRREIAQKYDKAFA
jgi:perosamine synthetase